MVDAGLLVSTMALRNPHHVLVLAGTLAALAACASQPPPEPEIASAAGEFGYAARYPGQLGATRGELLALENKTGRVIAKFPNYPSELKDPDWSRVLEVVERADQAGRSAAYVARTRHVRNVAEFFDQEREPIQRRVGGAAQYAAAQKGCKDAPVYAAAVRALDKSVQKRIEERLREHSEAHLYIQENRDALGQKNTEALKTQADEISYTSYVVHIAMVELKVRLRERLEQAEEVKATLERKVADALAARADTNRSEADKQAADANVEVGQRASGSLQSEIKQAEHVLAGLDERIDKLQRNYQSAFAALKESIATRTQL